MRLRKITGLVALVAALCLGFGGCSSDDHSDFPDVGVDTGPDDDAAVDGAVDVAQDADAAEGDGPLPPDIGVDTVPHGPWQQLANPAKVTLNDVWGTAANDIYAVGNGGIVLHWDGNLWEVMNNTETDDLYGVFGVDKNTIFAVGDGIAVVYSLDECAEPTVPDAGSGDGSVDSAAPSDPCPPGQYCDKDGYCKPGSWQEAYSSSYKANFRGVWGTEVNNLWVVGLEGSIKHKTSSSSYWSSSTSGVDEDLFDIIGFAEDKIFAVGAKGTILLYDGSSWSTMTSNTSSDLQSVWGSSATDVYAVGFDGAIVHYDGSEWKKIDAKSSSYFYGVWGNAANDVWVVGHPVFDPDQSVFHFDGSSWTNVSPQFQAGGLNGVWTNKANEAYVVGNFSLLYYKK